MDKVATLCFRWFVLAILATVALAETKESSPVVEVEGGKIRGTAENGLLVFKGIPYAAPPVGDLRWRNPRPVKPWQEVRDATSFGAEGMQSDDVLKSEDCLFLNVWQPTGTGPFPVMVWIYGGGLIHGQTSLYPADALSRQGVVVVSMNYRMGRLGFFAHPALAAEAPDEVRGNYGYMDQRAALQWVQRNIASFAGDPDNVTLFGESAGGGSVLVHLTSPMSRGLFHRVIMESPGIPTPRAKVTPMTELADAEKVAVDYTSYLGISGNGPEMLKALRALSAEKLIERASTKEVIGAITSETSVLGVSGSIVDGKLVVETPEKAFAAGHQARVPVIIGANDRDLGAGSASSKDDLFAIFGLDMTEARKAYDPLGEQTLDELKQQVFADKTMCEPARHLANQIARGGQPVWLYRFGYVAESQRGQLKGTSHGFEIPFVFNIPAVFVGDKVSVSDKWMGTQASAYWISFAKTGDPNGDGRPIWPRHAPAVDRLLHFNNSGIIVGTDPLKPRLDCWEARWRRESPASDVLSSESLPVTVFDFPRAESNLYFGRYVAQGRFGKLGHNRDMTNIDKQDVVRMNRDTIYSSGVFDLGSSPLTITLPNSGERFMSLQAISEDHHTIEVNYRPGRYGYTREKVGTRYVFIIIRTLANPNDPADMSAAHALQDAIVTDQSIPGEWQAPSWDDATRTKIRDALVVLGTTLGPNNKNMFGAKEAVDPVLHLIGTAIGWGGNPRSAAVYESNYPQQNDGKTVYSLTVRDVPVDGFWSISVYNAKGYFEKNDLGVYTVNNLTGTPNSDGSFTITFGGDPKTALNHLPITAGWNYTVRLYRPRKPILDGTWTFPKPEPKVDLIEHR